jgi:hypothetical protein
MNPYTRDYADGTSVTIGLPFGTYTSAVVMCSDGKARRVSRIAQCADTFFSVPCSVRVKGRTVAGYMTGCTRSGLSTATDGDPGRMEFHAYTYRKNHALLPREFVRNGAT